MWIEELPYFLRKTKAYLILVFGALPVPNKHVGAPRWLAGLLCCLFCLYLAEPPTDVLGQAEHRQMPFRLREKK